MKKVLAVIDRLKKGFEIRSEGDIAELLGISKTALANHKSRGTVPYDAMFTFCESSGVSLDWLFMGKGQMRDNAAPETDDAILGYVSIPSTFDQMAHIKRGVYKRIPDKILAFKKDWIANELGADPEDLQTFQIPDDTMEPTFRVGDQVVIDCKYCKDYLFTLTDGIYVLNLDGYYSIKRLQILPDGMIQLSCDNQSYKPFHLKYDQVKENTNIVGRVVWVGKKMI